MCHVRTVVLVVKHVKRRKLLIVLHFQANCHQVTLVNLLLVSLSGQNRLLVLLVVDRF